MARAVIAAALVTYALAVVQSSLGGRMALWGVSPDLLLVWTVCLALLAGPEAGAVTGFASGALQGSLGQMLIGPLGVSKTLTGAAAGLLGKRLYRDNLLVPAVCALLLTPVNEAVFLIISRFSHTHDAWRIIGVRAVYHMLLAVPIYALAARAQRALLARRRPVG